MLVSSCVLHGYRKIYSTRFFVVVKTRTLNQNRCTNYCFQIFLKINPFLQKAQLLLKVVVFVCEKRALGPILGRYLKIKIRGANYHTLRSILRKQQ